MRQESSDVSAERLRHEDGFTLIELMVAMVIFSIVLSAVLSLLDTANRTAYNDQERNTALNEQAIALHRMTGELRQAYQVNGPLSGSTSDYMDVNVRIMKPGAGQQDRRVLYWCANQNLSTGYDQCLRYETTPNDPTITAEGTMPTDVTPTVAIPRVVNQTSSDPNDPVFTNLASPGGSSASPVTYGELTVKAPGSGERTIGHRQDIVLNDSFYMPELDFGR